MASIKTLGKAIAARLENAKSANNVVKQIFQSRGGSMAVGERNFPAGIDWDSTRTSVSPESPPSYSTFFVALFEGDNVDAQKIALGYMLRLLADTLPKVVNYTSQAMGLNGEQLADLAKQLELTADGPLTKRYFTALLVCLEELNKLEIYSSDRDIFSKGSKSSKSVDVSKIQL